LLDGRGGRTGGGAGRRRKGNGLEYVEIDLGLDGLLVQSQMVVRGISGCIFWPGLRDGGVVGGGRGFPWLGR
jgi:hypothetical protein